MTVKAQAQKILDALRNKPALLAEVLRLVQDEYDKVADQWTTHPEADLEWTRRRVDGPKPIIAHIWMHDDGTWSSSKVNAVFQSRQEAMDLTDENLRKKGWILV